MGAPLNPKQEAACQARARGLGTTDSYASAGFQRSPPSATKFFQRPEIAERVREIVEEKYADALRAREIGVQKAGIDEAWISKRLIYLTDVSIQGRPIKDRDGKVTSYTPPNHQVAVQCLRLAAQMRGLLIQRTEIGAPGDFERMTDDDLEAKAAEVARRIGLTAPAKPNAKTRH